MKNRIIQTLLAVVISFIGVAQEVSFTTSVSANKVGVTDRFQVTYSSNKRGNFVAPKFANFKQVSQFTLVPHTEIVAINGQLSQRTTYRYSVVLQPKKVGKYKIEGAKININNGTYESKPAIIEVVKESQIKRRSSNPLEIMRQMDREMDELLKRGSRSRSQITDIDEDDFFIKIALSKSTVFEGEAVVASYQVYARNLRFGMEDNSINPHQDFWTEVIEIPKKIKQKTEIINGKRYNVYTIYKELLFPEKTGKLKLEPFTFSARIQPNGSYNAFSRKFKSNAPSIQVESLPANAPAIFQNQVGTYNMTVDVAVDSVQVNEPIDMTIKISGKGNLKQLNTMELTFPEELEVYDPEVKSKLSVTESGVKGSKTYNYLIIPRKSGKFTLPEVSFSYFDLASKSYKTITADQLEIIVVNEDGQISQETVEEKPVESKKAEEQTVSFNIKYLWMGLLGLGIIGLGAFLFLFIGKRKSKEETEEERRKNARKKLAQKLVVAKSHLDKNEVAQFYNETLIGLNKYVNEKLNIETAQMTKATIRETLASKSVSDSTINSFVEVLEQCEMAKYAPLSTQNNQAIYEKSLDVIGEMEGQMK